MTTEKRLERIIRDLFIEGDVDAKIASDEDFIECGICDSLGLVKLVTALEEEFPDIQIHDQEINRETMGSLDLLNAFIKSKQEVS